MTVAVGLLTCLALLWATAVAVRLYLETGHHATWLVLAGAFMLWALLTAAALLQGTTPPPPTGPVMLFVAAMIAAGLTFLVPWFHQLMQHQERTGERMRRLEALRGVVEGFGRISDGRDFLADLDRLLVSEGGVQRWRILEWHRDPLRLQLHSRSEAGHLDCGGSDEATPPLNEPAGLRAMHLRRPVARDDRNYCFPICDPCRRHGFLQVEFDQPPRPQQLQLTCAVAALLSPLLNSLRGGEDPERAVSRLRSLIALRDDQLASLRRELARVRRTAARQERRLSLMRSNYSRAARVRDALLNRVNGSLRSPLNNILGFSRALQEDPVEPLSGLQRSSVEEIVRATEKLRERIDAWLDLARIQSAETRQPRGPLHLEESWRTAARIARLDPLHLEMEGDPPPSPLTDEKMLITVLTNLMMAATGLGPLDSISAIVGSRGETIHLTISFACDAPPLEESAERFLDPPWIRLEVARQGAQLLGGVLEQGWRDGEMTLELELPRAVAAEEGEERD